MAKKASIQCQAVLRQVPGGDERDREQDEAESQLGAYRAVEDQAPAKQTLLRSTGAEYKQRGQSNGCRSRKSRGGKAQAAQRIRDRRPRQTGTAAPA